MQMGTRFQIIEGGKLSVTKTAFNAPPYARTSKPKRTFSSVMILAPMAVFYAIWSWMGPSVYSGQAVPNTLALLSTDTDSASFSMCPNGGGQNCVVDGDTLYYQGTKIRVADIDTPETHPPRCAEEARLGEAATLRLHALVNAGPFQLQTVDRDEDSYGRKLRIISRGGVSIGNELVNAGLARWYQGGRKSWC
jgi:micrococcal nuclease